MRAVEIPACPVRFSGLVCGLAVAIGFLWCLSHGEEWISRLLFGEQALYCLAFALLLGALSLFYTKVRPEPYLARLLAITGILLLLGYAGLLLSYLAPTARFAMVDAHLARLDLLLGFDFPAYVRFACESTWVRTFAIHVYSEGTALMVLGTLGYLVFTRALADLESLLCFLVVSVLATIAVGTLFPAGSAFAFHRISPEAEAALNTIVTASQNLYFGSVRDGNIAVLETGLRGMVACPSFHTVLGIMVILYLRANFWLMVPVSVLALAMIATTPLIGGHYFVDVLGGIGVALASFAVAERLVHGRREQLVLAPA